MARGKNRNRLRREDGTLAPNGADESELKREVVRPHRFQPGQSGNPGGRPPGMRALKERIAQITDNGVALVDWIDDVRLGVVEGMNDPRVRFAAAEWMHDRLFGKIKQTVEIEDGQDKDAPPAGMPLEAILDLLDGRDRADLERILTTIELAKRDGRLALPPGSPPPIDVDPTEN